MIRYGAMNFPILPVVDEIRAFAGLGFDYLELAMDPPMAHYAVIDDARDAILEALAATGLGIVGHLPTFVHTADLTPGIREASLQEMRRSLDTAAALGITKAVVHPGLIRGMALHVRDTALALAIDGIARIERHATDLGIGLCIENMFPALGGFFRPSDFDVIFERFPRMQLTLDTGHAHIMAGGNQRLFGFLERFGQRLGHVHVSDNHGRSDDHLAVGQGAVDFAGVAARLQAAGYDGTVTFEVFDSDRRHLVDSRRRFSTLMGAAR